MNFSKLMLKVTKKYYIPLQSFICKRLSQYASSNNYNDLSFSNHEAAFRTKKTADLIRAYAILSACSNDKIADHALELLRNGERIVGKRAFGALMRHTLYAQFVAGESGPAVIEAAKSLHNQGLRLMVAPTLEADVGEAVNYKNSPTEMSLQDRNLQELMKLALMLAATEDTSASSERKYPCLQLKMTAIVPTDILVQLSTIINKIVNNLRDYIKLVEELTRLIINENVLEVKNIEGLNDNQHEELILACRRLQQIGKEAIARHVRLLVDMEWTYVNPACSALASAMMFAFNKQRPNVCSTVQCYLRSALTTLAREEALACAFGVCYGAKLVRGAYLERERQVAPNLVCESYDATSTNYHRVMEAGVRSALAASKDRHFLVVATHNEAAVHNAVNLLHKFDATNNRNVAFAQIYGMAEHISLPLAQSRFVVYKSVAFGELSQVLPYLARRAAENRAIMRGARRERELLMREISRRMHLPL